MPPLFRLPTRENSDFTPDDKDDGIGAILMIRLQGYLHSG